MMKKLTASIMAVIAAIPIAVSAYTLTVDVDGVSTPYTVDSAIVTSDANGMLLTVTGLVTAPPPATNVAPVVNTSNMSITEGSTAIGNISVSDANGDATTLAFSGTADNALFNLSGTGNKTLSFKNAPAGSNVYTVEVTATDDDAPPLSSAPKTITVTVNADTPGGTTSSSCPDPLYPSGVDANTQTGLIWNKPINNERVTLTRDGTIESIAVHTPPGIEKTGLLLFADSDLAPNTKRTMWISDCPGGPITQGKKRCTVSGTGNGTIKWSTLPPAAIALRCELDTDTDYYVNIRTFSWSCKDPTCNVTLTHR